MHPKCWLRYFSHLSQHFRSKQVSQQNQSTLKGITVSVTTGRAIFGLDGVARQVPYSVASQSRH
jgi:hypothetical protein